MINLYWHALHLLVYYIICCWQWISWRLTGVHRHLMSTRNGENYFTSAQLLKVWSRSRNGLGPILDLQKFITSHVGFVHPEFALQKHIILMTVTRDYVIFCVPGKDVNLYNSRRFPFLFNAVFEMAEYLLVMPTSSFIKLAESVPDTKAKVLWIYHQGRCGSTALVQAFNALPNALAMSEPTSFCSLFQSFIDKMLSIKYDQNQDKEYHQMFRCVMKMSLKPALKSAEIIVVKTIAMNPFSNFDLHTEYYPDIHILFLYRDASAQITSLYRALLSVWAQSWSMIVDSLTQSTATTNNLALRYNCCVTTKQHVQWVRSKAKIKPFDIFMNFVLGWAENCHHYRDIVQRQKLYVPSIKYEHMISNMRSHLTFLFEYLGLALTEEQFEIMDEALSRDSQESSFISKEKVSKRKVEVTPEMIDEANECLEYYGLPNWGETLVLPHTISK